MSMSENGAGRSAAILRRAGPEGVAGILLMVAILVVMALGVFFRYVLNDSLSWSEELSRYGLVYVTFIGAAYAGARGTHIRVAVLDEMLPPGPRRWLNVFQDVVAILFLAVLAYLSIRIAGVLHRTKSAAMLLPMSFVYAAIIIGSALAVVRMTVRVVRTIRS